MIVAIDGPAGVGKSTIARWVSRRFQLFYLNSGKFYRALALLSHQRGISHQDSPALEALAAKMDFSVKNGNLHLGTKILGQELHTADMDKLAPLVSRSPMVRSVITEKIQNITKNQSIVCEGRDMTTVVFPKAEVKIFLDATPEVRAQRRFKERPEGKTIEVILEETKRRDHIDRNKAVGGLKIAEDASVLDTSTLTISQVCEKVGEIIKEQIKHTSI
jgi:cytidylate kinase